MTQQKRFRSLVALLVGLCLVSVPATALAGYADVIMADNPVLYYGMNDVSGNLDDSAAGSNDAVATGTGMTYGVAGPITNDASNTAISLTGTSDYFVMSDNDLLDFGTDQDFSVEFWFKVVGNAGYDGFYNVGDTGGGFWGRVNADNSIQCLLDYGSTDDKTVVSTTNAAAYLNDEWHHYALVADRDTSLTLYFDGSVVASDTSMTVGGNVNSNIDLWIGMMSSHDYNGSMDEFAIYNKALTTADISEHITAATATAEVPEPSTIVLLLAGLSGLFVIRRR